MRNPTLALLLTFLTLLCPLARADSPAASAPAVPNGLYFGPCVTQVTASSAKILWVMNPGTPVTSRVEVASAKVELQTKPIPIPDRKELVHVAAITGLKPGQSYPYKLTFSQAGESLGEISGTFQTPAASDSIAPLHFVIYGDSRSFPERHRAVAAAIDHENPAFVVHTGDFTDYTAVWPLWQKQFFEPAHDLLRHAAFWPTLGNHEEDGDVCRAIFDMPASYYSFDNAGLHVVVLDSELDDPKDHAAMLAWLEKDLTASKAPWKIVCYHRGTFDIVYYRYTFGQADLLPILEKCGVDLVVNGHSHNYQRFRPIGTPGKKPIIFVISGGGGAPSYPIFPSPILEKNHFGLNYCAFTITATTLEMKAKGPDGAVLDQLTLTKTAGLYQKEIMDRALPIDFAQNAAFLLSGFSATTAAPIVAGQSVTFNISPLCFPQGASVQISAPVPAPQKIPGNPKAPWTIKPITLTGWQAHPGVDDAHPDQKYAPITFTATAPSDYTPPNATEPALHISLRVTYQNQTYTTDSAGLYLLSQPWLDYLKARGF